MTKMELSQKDRDEIRRLRGAMDSPSPAAVNAMTDDEKVAELTKRGFVPGAIVRRITKPELGFGEILSVGRSIKRYSKDADKAEDVHVDIRWRTKKGFHVVPMNTSSACTSLEVIEDV